MVVGKTSLSISKTEIFNHFSEIQVLSCVFPEVKTLPCLICSPLREDRHPSFYIYINSKGNIRYKDYAYPEEYGNLIDLLCKYWHLSFNQTIDKICELFIFNKNKDNNIEFKPKNIRILSHKEKEEQSTIKVAVRPWHDYDYEYWSSYGITSKYLHWAEIYPISYKIVFKGGSKYVFPADKYAYVFVERKDKKLQLKIYQPFNKKGFKWCSKMDRSVWGLWSKIPQVGKNLIIGSSVKDCLNLSCNLHIPAICMQGEGYKPKVQIMEELKSRYKNIIVFFDNDFENKNNPGRKDAISLSEEYDLKKVEIPAKYQAKDPSDLYKKYGKEKYMEIMKEILSPVLI